MKEKPLVLIVDDERGIRALMSTLCAEAGYRTAEAADGAEAIERVDAEEPDLILMDAMMPVIDGFAATGRLKSGESTNHIPIIMLTGQLKHREDKIRGIRAGADDFLTKPADTEELLLKARNYLKIKSYHDFLADHSSELEREVDRRTKDLRKALDDLKTANETISSSYKDTIDRLTSVSEYRDEDTGYHIKRISRYSVVIAEALGKNGQFLDTIYYAAAMHDIGKVSVPDRILLKPGKLDEEEWEIMKNHTLAGARMLYGSDSPYLEMGNVIAESHHERWDGSGYPNGLKGDAIPVEGRIVNIVDQYDALRSRRPYKPAFSHDEVMKIITEGDGRTNRSHFDPEILSVLTRNHKKLEEIYEGRL